MFVMFLVSTTEPGSPSKRTAAFAYAGDCRLHRILPYTLSMWPGPRTLSQSYALSESTEQTGNISMLGNGNLVR